MNDGAYEAEDECDDGDEREDRANPGPVDRGPVRNWDWGVYGQLFGQGSSVKAAG